MERKKSSSENKYQIGEVVSVVVTVVIMVLEHFCWNNLGGMKMRVKESPRILYLELNG